MKVFSDGDNHMMKLRRNFKDTINFLCTKTDPSKFINAELFACISDDPQNSSFLIEHINLNI